MTTNRHHGYKFKTFEAENVVGGEEGKTCVRIIFTRKLCSFKVFSCLNGQLSCTSRELMWVETPSGSLPTRRMSSPCPFLSAFVYSVLLRVLSLGSWHLNHLRCQFKLQIPKDHPRLSTGKGLGFHKHTRGFQYPLEFETVIFAFQGAGITQNNF